MVWTAYAALWLLPVLAVAGRAMAKAAHTRTTTPSQAGRNRGAPRSTVHSSGMRIYLDRLHAERAQRRQEQQEFQAWLQITARPL
jgi:hypothetical protein